jgi:hypothetical protein
MPFVVSQGRSQRMTFSSTGDNNVGVNAQWHQDYCVDVTGADIATHSAYDVLNATGIPVVGKTTYSTGTKILPYVVCRDKTCQQNPKKLSRWTVKAKFSTPPARSGGSGAGGSTEAENAPIDIPATIEEIDPVQSVSLGEKEEVLYFERFVNQPKNCALTPTGNWWSNPVVVSRPTFKLKYTQYESSITYEQMLERKFTVNSIGWNSKPKLMWLIEEVEAQDVSVQLLAGDADAAMVTYTIALHPDSELADGDPQKYGWQEVRALFDTQYFEEEGGDQDNAGQVKLKAFQSDIPGKPNAGYIDIDGFKRESQEGEPDYIAYNIYEPIDFNTFLRL